MGFSFAKGDLITMLPPDPAATTGATERKKKHMWSPQGWEGKLLHMFLHGAIILAPYG